MAASEFPPLRPSERPYITVTDTAIFITDKVHGYHRELTLDQLRHLLADGLEGQAMALRTGRL